jgi:hypothetical protein
MFGPKDDGFMITPTGDDTTIQSPDGDTLTWPKSSPQPAPLHVDVKVDDGLDAALANIEKALEGFDDTSEPTGPPETI